MEKQETGVLKDVLNLVTHFWAWGAVIFTAILGRVGLYLRSSKKETGWQLFGSFCIAISVGTITAFICAKEFPSPVGSVSIDGALITAFMTWTSDKVLIFIVNMDRQKALKLISKKDLLSIFRILIGKKNDGDEK